MVLSKKKKVGVFIAVAISVAMFLFVSRNLFENSDSLNPLAVNNGEEIDTNSDSPKLGINDTTIGDGATATSGDLLVAHYVGTLDDGTKFDSSRDRGVPIEFTLGAGQVIAGWDQGLQGMQVGGVRVLTIPPELGYGADAVGPIPPNSTLIFEIELLEIKTP
jgi:peptidylprolyl isomerase